MTLFSKLKQVAKRWLFLVLVVILLIGLAAFLLNDFIQENIAPGLLSWMWGVWIMSAGFPQVMTWAFFVALIPVIAIFSLIRGRPLLEEEESSPEDRYPGQVQVLARWLQQIPEGDYFRMRVVRHLSGLALDALAYQERLSPDEIKANLDKGELQIDSEAYEYLKSGWRKRAFDRRPTTTSRRRISQIVQDSFRGGGEAWSDPQTENFIQYIESILEVEREG